MAKGNIPKNCSEKLSTKSQQSFVKLIYKRCENVRLGQENRPDGIIVRPKRIVLYKSMFSNTLWDIISVCLPKTLYIHKLR